MSKQRSALTLALMLALPILAHADASDDELLYLQQFYSDEDTVSIATGTSKPIHLAPAVASVIHAKDILRMGATTLEEALARIFHTKKAA